MIAPSIAAFINAQTPFAAVGVALKAFSKSPSLVLGELPAPFALVSPLTERPQELWVIGDAQRKENPIFQVSFYATSEWQAAYYKAEFRRLIEAAHATDDRGVSIPGINYLAYADFLIDGGDHKAYSSNQPSWFSSPTPIVYKNVDSNGEPVVVASGFTIDSTLGKVNFASANLATDIIRATYKSGVIDFDIVGVADFETSQEADMANNPQRFVVTFTLEAFYYIKYTSNRYV